MFSWCVFMVFEFLALIRSWVWFCFNFVCLLPFLIFLFICRGGWGGKPQCFILLTEFCQLSCFITMQKLLQTNCFLLKALIVTRTTTISIVHFYCYCVISFLLFNISLFNITRFYICYWVCCLLSFIISRWIALKLSSVLLRKCISY